jgi:hypothetical protein
MYVQYGISILSNPVDHLYYLKSLLSVTVAAGIGIVTALTAEY